MEPRDATSIESILHSLVERYEDDVPLFIHEVYTRYMQDVLLLAKAYADLRGDAVNPLDIKAAISARAITSFRKPAGMEKLRHMADSKNKLKLASFPDKAGILLPSDEHCLIAPNLQVPGDIEEDVEF
jgi:hypothetical protein